MLKLAAHGHKYLSVNNIKMLAQNRIVTVFDFLLEDVEKLAIITKLNIQQIVEIRTDIYAKYAAPVQCGTDLILSHQSTKTHISTGVACLDSVLNGGIPTRNITEICGLAGSGKTQICMHLAVNQSKSSATNVLYIDTKGDFSAVRIQKMLDMAGHSHKEIASIMLRIKIVFIWGIENLLDLTKELKSGALENVSLIIIDSLPSLMFQHFGDNNKIGYTYLNTLVSHLRYLCKEMHLSVICVNVQTRWVDQEGANPDENHTFESADSRYQEKRIRCLGKYWQHIPYLVMNFEKQHETLSQDSNSFQCNVTVYECNIPQIYRNCLINIGLAGIT